METQTQKKPFYKQVWFWLIIVGVILILVGLLFLVTKWISNNLITLGIAGLGLVIVIIGVILIFVSRNSEKKKQEMAEQESRETAQLMAIQQQRREMETQTVNPAMLGMPTKY